MDYKFVHDIDCKQGAVRCVRFTGKFLFLFVKYKTITGAIFYKWPIFYLNNH